MEIGVGGRTEVDVREFMAPINQENIRPREVSNHRNKSPVRAMDNVYKEMTKDKYEKFNIRHFQTRARKSTNEKIELRNSRSQVNDLI